MQTGIELVLASKNSVTGDILYTFKQVFPRIILAEVNTHTIASKNTASSRAIPTMKMLKMVWNDPFIPTSIGKYQSGMQAGKEITGLRRSLIEGLWRYGRLPALAAAWMAYKLGAPKQFSNRLVEPWTWTEQIWTATDVENELLLRNHWMAEPHYEKLAQEKAEVIAAIKDHFEQKADWETRSAPWLLRKIQTLDPGQWHLPFVNLGDLYHDLEDLIHNKQIAFVDAGVSVLDPKTSERVVIAGLFTYMDVAKAVSAARCAWVSYFMPGDGSKKMNNVITALFTFKNLAAGQIRHLSPLQHIATPLPFSVRVGSHAGWMMYRKELAGEAGGDKVIPSITPHAASILLSSYFAGSDNQALIAQQKMLLGDAILEQQTAHGSVKGLFVA